MSVKTIVAVFIMTALLSVSAQAQSKVNLTGNTAYFTGETFHPYESTLITAYADDAEAVNEIESMDLHISVTLTTSACDGLVIMTRIDGMLRTPRTLRDSGTCYFGGSVIPFVETGFLANQEVEVFVFTGGYQPADVTVSLDVAVIYFNGEQSTDPDCQDPEACH